MYVLHAKECETHVGSAIIHYDIKGNCEIYWHYIVSFCYKLQEFDMRKGWIYCMNT